MEKKRNKNIIKEYLVLREGYPVEEASWILAEQFSYPGQLREYLEEDNPQEEKVYPWGHSYSEGGVVVTILMSYT